MNNHVVLIGRINNDIEKIEIDDKLTYKLLLNISRYFKNQDGDYENDIIPVELMSYVGNTTFEYCKKDDLVGIRGRIESKENNPIKIIAEKVTFLSNNRNLINQN